MFTPISPESDGCNQCINIGTECISSRFGVIRRKRKRTSRAHDYSQAASEASIKSTPITTTAERSIDIVQCHLAPDIEATRERLSTNATSQQQGLIDALSSLSEPCTNTGLRYEAPKLQTVPRDSNPFEGHAAGWAESRQNSSRAPPFR
ncbi:uncharacterized protein N7483_008383 [Penicillium malachiteum]|uniref:uncharacterized protein n=1 Tax=Penicillium malachiteum TaxID=1324776 RepID=UPI002547EF0A|nr:uncharacterized protein N7483_008383 [Penicillium malachiteum]KAJ5720449.1 hypothetical protein N7483_008383 [Penicillium malachiteum]